MTSSHYGLALLWIPLKAKPLKLLEFRTSKYVANTRNPQSGRGVVMKLEVVTDLHLMFAITFNYIVL